MSCKSCGSEKQTSLNSEINIHFSGYSGLSKPTVWAFPTLLVCLNCGFSEFSLTETELCMVAEGKAA